MPELRDDGHDAPADDSGAGLHGVQRDSQQLGRRRLSITCDLIIDHVAEFYGRTRGQLLGRERYQPLARQRQIAMYLCRDMTDLSAPAVARAFGRDHSTILHAARTIELQAAPNSAHLAYDIALLRSRIRRAAT